MNGGRDNIASSTGSLTCCSWNVKGFTDLKLMEILLHMQQYSIEILCLQETHLSNTAGYKEEGYLVILSGADG